ncbi:MAG: pyruvate/2-oxoglutarate/acetoin dehydrogenase E1 component [Myxococcota bacterium]|jgi:pyruvate/2-oxoglutarate/acetoin dehydrogenase E1 component
MNATQAIHGLLSAALKSGNAHILGEALELSPATSGLLALSPDQVHLLPAADATLIGIAVGLAMSGARPVIELAGPDAVWGILQQLGQEAALLTGEFAGSVIIRVPLAPGESAPVAALAALPGVTLAAPSSGAQAAGILAAALKGRGTVVILEAREQLREGVAAVPDVRLGEAEVVRAGEHVSVLAWGRGVAAALSAAETLSDEGIEAEVIDLRTINPLDTATIAASVNKTGRPVLAGCPESVLSAAVRAAFLRLESPPEIASADEAEIIRAVRASVSY